MSTLYTAPFMLMGLANFSIIASFACFYMFPLFVLDRGGSQADVGVIMGSFSLASVLCRPWVSDMVDKVGRKRCLTLGTLIISLAPLAYAWFRGNVHDIYGLVLLVRIVHGVGLAICSTAVFTYVTDIIPPHRLIEGIGIFGVSGLVGLAFGPVIAEVVIREWGFTMFFITASLLGTIAVVCHQGLTDPYVAQERIPAPSFFQLLRRGKLLLVASLSALFGISVAATGSFVSPFAREQHLHFIAFYYIAYSTAAVLTRVGGARLADRVGERRVLPYALLLSSAGLLLTALLGGSIVLVLAGLLSGCGHGFLFPSLNALAVRDEPAQNRGKVTGIFTGSIDAGIFAGSILLGYVGDWMGFRALFVTAGLAMLAGLAFRPWQAAEVSPPDEVVQGGA